MGGMDFKRKGKKMETVDEESKSSLSKGLSAGYTRVSLVMREDLVEKLRALAYWERTQMKDVIEELLEIYVASKDIKPIPKEKKKIFR